MNVAEDRLVNRWFKPRSLEIAQAEFNMFGEVTESERSDRDKRVLIMNLLRSGRQLEAIVHFAQNTTADLNVQNTA